MGVTAPPGRDIKIHTLPHFHVPKIERVHPAPGRCHLELQNVPPFQGIPRILEQNPNLGCCHVRNPRNQIRGCIHSIKEALHVNGGNWVSGRIGEPAFKGKAVWTPILNDRIDVDTRHIKIELPSADRWGGDVSPPAPDIGSI